MNGMKWLILLIFLSIICWFYAHGFRPRKCKRPNPPGNAVLSAASQLSLYRNNGFPTYDRVRFQCKVGYKAQGVMWSLCGDNGEWTPNPRTAGSCIYDRRRSQSCGNGQYRCLLNGECIDRRLRCDCIYDCPDGSDEDNCQNPRRIIIGNEGEKSSGVVTSPGYPKKYPRKFSCTYSLLANPNTLFNLVFEEIDLRVKTSDQCRDFIKISGVHPATLSSLNKDNRMSKSDLGLSMVICGHSNPSPVISNSSSLDVVVSLDGGIQGNNKRAKYRGFGFTWSLVQRDAILHQLTPLKSPKIKENKKVNFIAENYVTVVVPIIISAIVPFTLIVFMCKRQLRNTTELDVISESASYDHRQACLKSTNIRHGVEGEMVLCYKSHQHHSCSQLTCNGIVKQAPKTLDTRPNISDDVLSPPTFYPLTVNDNTRNSHSISSLCKTHSSDHDMGTYPSKTAVTDNIYTHNTKQRSENAPKPNHGAGNSCRKLHQGCKYSANDSRNSNAKLRESDRFITPHNNNTGLYCVRTNSELDKRRVDQRHMHSQHFVNSAEESKRIIHGKPCPYLPTNHDAEHLNRRDFIERYPCHDLVSENHSKEIPFHGSLNLERFADGRILVAKQQMYCQHPNSETETETTKSSLV